MGVPSDLTTTMTQNLQGPSYTSITEARANKKKMPASGLPRARLPGNASRQLPGNHSRRGTRTIPHRTSTSPASIASMQATLSASAANMAAMDASSGTFDHSNSNQQLPLTWKTKTIKRLDHHTTVFHCTCRLATARINKNMVVLEHEGELSLINPLKLTAEGERKLGNLGRIRHILRLGPSLHGACEDEYYLQQHPQVQRWAPGPFRDTVVMDPETATELPIHRILQDRGDTPFPNCRVFTFASTAEPEACLLLTRTDGGVGNLLLTSDCLQSQKDNEFINMPVVARLKLEGLLSSDIVVSKPWLQLMGPPDTGTRSEQRAHHAKMAQDFRRLTALEFSRFLSTSGNVVKYGAKEGTILAVEHVFPSWGGSSHHRSNSR